MYEQDKGGFLLLGAALPGERVPSPQRQLHAGLHQHPLHPLPLRRGEAVQLQPCRKGVPWPSWCMYCLLSKFSCVFSI